MLPVVLRLVSGGRWIADLPSLPMYLFVVWFVLIVGAALLSRMLLNAEAPADPDETPAHRRDDGSVE